MALRAKKKLYLFSLLVATMSVLLSTVVMHHHHMGRICMVVERCQQDGKLNDEHTEHHENENDGCRVHQMHHFVTNGKIVKSIQKQLFDGFPCFLLSICLSLPRRLLACVGSSLQPAFLVLMKRPSVGEDLLLFVDFLQLEQPGCSFCNRVAGKSAYFCTRNY